MSLITKGNTPHPPPGPAELAPKPLVVDKVNESPAAAMNAVRAQENSQNMTNNMRGGWIPMGSNAYNIDQVNAVVNQNPRNASVGRRRLRRRERRALRHANAHGNNNGPYPHGYSQHRVTVKGLGGGGGAKKTARFSLIRNRSRNRNRSRLTRFGRRYHGVAIGSIQKRISRRVRMNLLHRKIRKSKNNYTQRRSRRRSRSRSQMQWGGETTVPQHGVSCAGGAAQQNCPGNTSAALLDASRQAAANAQGDAATK
jgi:hypothetical protein